LTWLALAWFLRLGTIHYTGEFVNPPLEVLLWTPPNSYATTLGVEAELFDDHVFAGGSVETWESSNGVLFSPSQSIYRFGVGARLNGIEIGWQHECDHVTLSSFDTKPCGFMANRDEFYVSYTGKIKVF
jgi:hypothetical protein